jgi:hypothetical protein
VDVCPEAPFDHPQQVPLRHPGTLGDQRGCRCPGVLLEEDVDLVRKGQSLDGKVFREFLRILGMNASLSEGRNRFSHMRPRV